MEKNFSLVEKFGESIRGGSSTGGFQSGELTARLIAWQNLQFLQSSEVSFPEQTIFIVC